MGMALPGTAAHPVVVPTTGGSDRLNPQKVTDCEDSVKALMVRPPPPYSSPYTSPGTARSASFRIEFFPRDINNV